MHKNTVENDTLLQNEESLHLKNAEKLSYVCSHKSDLLKRYAERKCFEFW